LRARQREVQQVALAALLHDVGKFAQRAEADPEKYRTIANLQEFAVTGPHGETAYHHAAYTWQFIESHLPWLTRLGNTEGNVGQWAARHHKPSTVWDWIVAESDRLSAGMDRGHTDEALAGWKAVQGARLSPLLYRIGGVKHPGEFEIPLKPLAMDETLFPGPSRARTREEAAAEYRGLFEGFTRSVGHLPEGDLPTFLESFLSIYERYTWCIPAATNTQPLDVSLFEHSRAAAAIAAALAAEVLAQGAGTVDQIRDRRARRYVVAVGDLGGIQRFLYTIVANRAARALRGRSFALQLLTDAIGRKVLRDLGLPSVNMLYNSGGKIWLLLPASASEAVLALAERIDLGLHRRYSGRLSFTLGVAGLSGEDFISKRIADRFEQAANDMQARRRRRFPTLLRSQYAEVFEPVGDPEREQPCGVCGKLAANLQGRGDEARPACEECRDFEDLGAIAVRCLAIIRAEGADCAQRLSTCHSRLGFDQRAWSYELPDLDGGYLICSGAWEGCLSAAGEDLSVLRLNEPPETSGAKCAVGMWLAGLGRAQDDAGATIDFDGLAETSEGIERLGILRMDVDSLGEIFRSGLTSQEATFSRITNLSKNLSYFFGGYLSDLVSRSPWRDKAQIIYSGGDDLFIVTAWSTAPYLAREIRECFSRLTCGNPLWGISAGIAVVRPRFPVAAAADLAGEEERRAKQYKGRANGKPKDAVRFLGDTMSWNDLDVMTSLSRELCELLDAGDGPMPRSTLHRLADIASLYRRSLEIEAAARKKPLGVSEIEQGLRHGRWAWTAAYMLARSGGTERLRARLQRIADAMPTKAWLGLGADRDLIWLLQPAVRMADLLTRAKGAR
jgi:CRISPR-associated protein Csm1